MVDCKQDILDRISWTLDEMSDARRLDDQEYLELLEHHLKGLVRDYIET